MRIYLLALLLLIPLASAVQIFAGEPYEIQLNETYDYYSITGNVSDVKLEIIENGNNITLIVDKYTNDSFDIIFFNKEEKVITVYTGGGGGTRTVYKNVANDKTVYRDRDKIIYRDNETIVFKETDAINKQNRTLEYIMGAISVILIGILIWVVLKFKTCKEEQEYE